VKDYTHSTAPNRRFPDLITHRLLKSALAGRPSRLHARRAGGAGRALHIAGGRREQGGAPGAQVRGRLSPLRPIDEKFDAIVTGAGDKGTWVRILRPPVEGKLVHGSDGLDVGDRLRVKLVGVDVDRGFIDFVRTRH
jgi:exoribonuclease-2